jgi:hypothetical protein
MTIKINLTKLFSGFLALAGALPGAVFATTIGDVATNLMGPTEIVTKLVIVACYVVGLTLIFVAMAQYKIHRQSPKLVPLSTPVALLILGAVALLIPYATNMLEDSASAAKQNAGESERSNILPLPGQADVPGLPKPKPKKSAPQEPPPPKSADPAPYQGGGGGGHWTSDPRYQK